MCPTCPWCMTSISIINLEISEWVLHVSLLQCIWQGNSDQYIPNQVGFGRFALEKMPLEPFPWCTTSISTLTLRFWEGCYICFCCNAFGRVTVTSTHPPSGFWAVCIENNASGAVFMVKNLKFLAV